MRFRKVCIMASHITKLAGLLTQLASTKLVMQEPLKVAHLLVTLSEPKAYTAMVT